MLEYKFDLLTYYWNPGVLDNRVIFKLGISILCGCKLSYMS